MNYWIDYDKSNLSYNAWIMYYKDEICRYIQYIINKLDNKQLSNIMDNGSDKVLFEKISHIIYNHSHKGRPIIKDK